MAKIQKAISINEEIYDDIKKRKSSQYGFNFSDWVENRYKSEFLDIDAKKQELEEYREKIILLKEEIKRSEIIQESYKAAFSRSEIRFIKSIPSLLGRGMEMRALFKRFNITFNKDIPFEEFEKLVRYYEFEQKKKHK